MEVRATKYARTFTGQGGACDVATGSDDRILGLVAVRSGMWLALEAQWRAAVQYEDEIVRQIARAREAAAAAPNALVGASLADLAPAGAVQEVPSWDEARWSSDTATGLMDDIAACERHATRLAERYSLVQSATVVLRRAVEPTADPAVPVGDAAVDETTRRDMRALDGAARAFVDAAVSTNDRVREKR